MAQQIVIKPYEKEWYEEYVIEKEKFISLFGEDCIAIEHIGSTSVQGLGAKPLIDMMIGVTDLKVTETWIEALLKIGYEYVPKETPNWRFLERANGGQAPTIYMFIFIIVRSGRITFYFVIFLENINGYKRI